MHPAIVRAERHSVVCGLAQYWVARPSPMVVTYALVVPNRAHGAVPDEWQGETRLRVRLCGRSCTAVCTVRRMDARQMHAAVDSGCNENVHRMCELPNYGRVLVSTEVMALWRRSGDGRALRTHAPLAMERRTIHSGLSVGWEESQ
jgi:hypothetical protein